MSSHAVLITDMQAGLHEPEGSYRCAGGCGHAGAVSGRVGDDAFAARPFSPRPSPPAEVRIGESMTLAPNPAPRAPSVAPYRHPLRRPLRHRRPSRHRHPRHHRGPKSCRPHRSSTKTTPRTPEPSESRGSRSCGHRRSRSCRRLRLATTTTTLTTPAAMEMTTETTVEMTDPASRDSTVDLTVAPASTSSAGFHRVARAATGTGSVQIPSGARRRLPARLLIMGWVLLLMLGVLVLVNLVTMQALSGTSTKRSTPR